jgi:hypothetical protein
VGLSRSWSLVVEAAVDAAVADAIAGAVPARRVQCGV